MATVQCAALLLCVAALLAVGCAPVERRNGAARSHDEPATIELTAPPRLTTLLEDLLTYRAQHGRFPRALAELHRAGLMTAAEHAALPDYAYDGRGLGTLADGRSILLVDAEVADEAPNHVWCLLRHPVQRSGSPVLEVTLVPLSELDAAAAQAVADEAHSIQASRAWRFVRVNPPPLREGQGEG